MILATRHVGIVVHDMDAALHFWRDLMGLQVDVDFRAQGSFIDTIQALNGVDLHMIKLCAPDGTMIELLHDSAHPTPAPASNRLCDRGIRHLAFTVADVQDAYERLREAGCETLSAPVRAPDSKAQLFFVRDPEGNLLEIVQVFAV